MKNKKLIRIVESFVILPVMAMSMPQASLPAPDLNSVATTPYSVFLQKQNILTGGLFTSNKTVEDPKIKILQVQGQAIDAYFKKYKMPLEGTGMVMAVAADKHGLDYRLLPAISVRESTGGIHACTSVKYNAYGWGSCHIGFSSNEEAIETIAQNLGGNHPKTAKYYDNKTVVQILEAYNPPSIVPNYAKQVMRIMDAIGPEGTVTTPNELTSSYAPSARIM